MERTPLAGRLLFWGGLLLCEAAAGLAVLVLPSPLYGLLLGLLVPVLMLLWVKPLLGYMLMVFFLPNYGVELMKISETADLSLLEPAVFLAFVAWVIHCLKEGRLRFDFSGVDLTIFAVFVWVTLSILWAPGQFRSIQQLIKIIVVLGVYFLSIQMINSRRDFSYILAAWLALSVVVSVVGIYQLFTVGLKAAPQYVFTEHYEKIHRDVRTTSLFEGSDMAAFLLSLAVVLVITRYATLNPGGWRTLVWFLISLFLFVLVTTIARKSYIATAVAVVYLGYSARQMRRAVASVAPVVAVAVAVILAGPFSEAIMERLGSFLMPAEQAIPNRLPTWLLGLSFFMDSPLIGNGLGSFYVLATREGSPLVFPHNFYLFVLVEFGVVGMVLVLLWAYQFFTSFRRYTGGGADQETYLISRGLVAGAIVIVLHAFFRSFSFTDPTFWGFFGLCRAFLKVYPPALQGEPCEDAASKARNVQAQPVW